MAKRARLLTAEDVLDELDLEDDYDDFDEPMMPGSDDEFDDCDLVDEEDENDSDGEQTTPPSPTQQASSATPPLPTDWSSNLTSLTISDFNSSVGPTVPVPETASEVFDLMFTPSLMDTIVEQSNLYAEQVMGEEKYACWEKISSEELRAYFGFCILMEIAHLPALDDYWSTDPTLHYSPIADRISRDRFREISRYLHFANNTTLPARGSPGYDRLGKVRPVIDELSKRFTDLYKPHKEVAVDEAMIKFTGRSSVKQYMPMKPIKRGIKVHSILITYSVRTHGCCLHNAHNTVYIILFLTNVSQIIFTRNSMPHTHTHTHIHTLNTLNNANKGMGTC